MLPYSFIGAGTYLNGASPVAVNVVLSDRPDWFWVKDLTNFGASATAVNPIYAEWFSSMAPGSFLSQGQTNAAQPGAANMFSQRGTTNGFTFSDPSNPPLFANLASTGITDTTFVVAMANTGGIAVGDYVRIINPVAMLQISGMSFQVTAVTTNVSITLGYMASGGLTMGANATSAIVKKFIPGSFYPRYRWISGITPGLTTTVFFTERNDFTPGEMVDFNIPSAYGMTQLSFLTAQNGPARVLSVTNSATVSSIVIEVDSTGFTPFVFPASGIFLTTHSPASCFPAGSGIVPSVIPVGTNLQDAFDNRSQYLMNIGTSVVGSANATMQWVAMKADYSILTNA